MNIVLDKAIFFIEKHTGFYSKKGCIEAATRVGKQLIDAEKAGKVLTVSDLIQAVSENAPHVRLPNIATNENEFVSLLEKSDINDLEKAYSRVIMFNDEGIKGCFGPAIKGIFMRLDKKESENGLAELLLECFSPELRGAFAGVKKENSETAIAEVFAHEFEHYLEHYANPQTILKRLADKLNPNTYFKRKEYENQIERKLNSPDRENFIKEEIAKRPKRAIYVAVMEDMIRLFGAKRKDLPGMRTLVAEGYEPTTEGFEEFLKSPLFVGLDNDRRVDAYIRAIIRHRVHPLANPNKTAVMERSFNKEKTAYQVSDNLIRYKEQKEGITPAKVRVELFKRALKILEREKEIAATGSGRKPMKPLGLPKSALAEELYT